MPRFRWLQERTESHTAHHTTNSPRLYCVHVSHKPVPGLRPRPVYYPAEHILTPRHRAWDVTECCLIALGWPAARRISHPPKALEPGRPAIYRQEITHSRLAWFINTEHTTAARECVRCAMINPIHRYNSNIYEKRNTAAYIPFERLPMSKQNHQQTLYAPRRQQPRGRWIHCHITRADWSAHSPGGAAADRTAVRHRHTYLHPGCVYAAGARTNQARHGNHRHRYYTWRASNN